MPLPFTDLAQFIGDRLSRYESTPSPPLQTAAEIGNYGERVAASFVQRRGYKVLTRNYKTTRGEIDLVCRHGNVLVFIEVKTRSADGTVRPAESIDAGKEEALRHAADRYLELLDRDDVIYRFDAVEVQLKVGAIPACTLIPNFFS